MWYRFAKSDNINFEEKIVRADAERAIRRALFLKGVYDRTPSDVAKLVNQAVQKLTEKYGDIKLIRNSMSDDDLKPAVEEITSQVVK